MAFPLYREVELPLLHEIANAGGSVTVPNALYLKVAAHFPMLTPADLKTKITSGNETKWGNMVRWARRDLVKKGELESVATAGRGVWMISESGRARLRRERHLLPQPPGNIRQRVIHEDGGEYEERIIRLTEVRKRTQRQLVGIGSILHRFPVANFRQDDLLYDVIWKQAEHIPRATHCFQVNTLANLPNALPSLKHASDIWGANLFLVATDESETQTARQLILPHFTNNFRGIAAKATVMTASDVDTVFNSLNPVHELLGAMLLD